MKAAIGIWLARDFSANDREINSAIALAQAGEADTLFVGNETLLRGDLTVGQLVSYIARVKAAVPPAVVITTADTVDFWLDNPELLRACDQASLNIYPYWRGVGIDRAVATIHRSVLQVKSAAGAKPVVISESGWPSAGATLSRAVPSSSSAAAFFKNFVSWAKFTGTPYYYFEAYDEPWKKVAEGEQGGNWGIFNTSQRLKADFQEVFDGATVPDNWASLGTGIEIYHIPPYGNRNDLLIGFANDTPREAYRFYTLIRVGARWWTKPTFATPTVKLGADQVFAIDTTTGGIDEQANTINIYLVPATYSPPLVGDSVSIPAELNPFPRFEITRLSTGAGSSAPLPSSIAGRTVSPGGSTTFAVATTGSAPTSYQWRKGTSNIPGATGSSFTIANATTVDSDAYSVRTSNSFGTVTGMAAALVVDTNPVVILSQPTARTANEGTPAFFEVVAVGRSALRFQWRRNGLAIPGATCQALYVGTVLPSEAGSYDVAIASNEGNLTSASAMLTVYAKPPNNSFSLATTVAGQTVSVRGTTVAADKEVGEPNHGGQSGGASIWYRWQAPLIGPVTIETTGSTFDTVLGVYKGTGLSSLNSVASNNDSASGTRTSLVRFYASAADSFLIAVDGVGGAAGEVLLSIRQDAQDVPLLISQPQNVTATAGSLARLDAAAIGSAPLQFAWTKGETVIQQGIGSALIFNPVQYEHAGTYSVRISNALGHVTSSEATLTVRPPNNDFAERRTLEGQAVTYSALNNGGTKEPGEPNHAGVVGGASVWFSWTAPVTGPVSIDTAGSFFDTVLAIYTGSSFSTLTSVTGNNDTPGMRTSLVTFIASAGTVYQIAVDGVAAATGTILLHLDQVQQTLPVVASLPGQTAKESDQVVFRGTALGAPPPTIQWQRMAFGTGAWVNVPATPPFAGSTTATLTISAVLLAHDGDAYRYVATNSAGTAVSATITLAVLPSTRLSNLSFRCSMIEGSPLSVGVVRNGAPNPVLFRIVGPGLLPFLPPATVTARDPRLDVRDSAQNSLLANDNWSTAGDAASLIAQFSRSGAFPLPLGSPDAAGTVAAFGPHTVIGETRGSGVALIEAYDTSQDPSSRLVNFSARYVAGGANATLILGFSISGSGVKRLLLRAVGPGLVPFGVALGTVLADPRIEVIGVQTPQSNDNWSSALAGVFSSVGAFALTPGSRDAALVADFPPGNFTMVVSGGSGDCLLEAYEMLR